MARTKTNQYVSTVTCLPAKSDTCNWLHMKKTGKLGKLVRFHHKNIKQCSHSGDEEKKTDNHTCVSFFLHPVYKSTVPYFYDGYTCRRFQNSAD